MSKVKYNTWSYAKTASWEMLVFASDGDNPEHLEAHHKTPPQVSVYLWPYSRLSTVLSEKDALLKPMPYK